MHLRLIDDATDQLNVRQKPGFLLTIDYCEAFDRLSKHFILTLKNGFGPDFVKWVSVLIADAKSCVAYCGWLSEYFAVEAEIRQGCLFSPLAFILVVELLAIKNTTLWEHKRIKLLEIKKRPLGKYHKNCTICRRFNVVFKGSAGYAPGIWNFGWVSTISGI